MSRQYEWQLRKMAEGLCITCGSKPAVDKYRCAVCKEKHNIRQRNIYRRKKGIPLDLPLWQRKSNPWLA